MDAEQARSRAPKFRLSFFASPIAREKAVAASVAWVRERLEDMAEPGAVSAGPGSPATEAGVLATEAVPLAVVLTGGTEDQVLRSTSGQTWPVLLLALPHSNSLPACLEVLARLGQEGRPGRIVMADRGEWRAQLKETGRLWALGAFMRRARLGLLGGPSSWLAASSPDATTVRRSWGPEVVTIPLSEIIGHHGGGGARAAGPLAEGLAGSAAGTVEPDARTLDGAATLLLAFKAVAAAHRLDALTARCFDLLGELKNTGCFALSRLNDEGLVAACEGDLPAAVTMMVLGGLSGQACFMTNPSDVDPVSGTVTFAHCSVPLSLVKTYRLRSHFESGLGVGLEGHFGPGEMTVARIGGASLDRLTIFRGTVVPEEARPFREDLCRTQVTLRLSAGDIRDLLERPLGNHHLLTPGDHVRAFLDYYRMNFPARPA